MRFEFATASRVVFGAGSIQQAGREASAFGARALIVTGSNPARAKPLFDSLQASGIEWSVFPVSEEPRVKDALAGVEQAQRDACAMVIGFGGGSALDCAKAIGAFLANPGDPFEYLEVIGRARPLPNAPAPTIAIPTTAGTGSEVTRNAVLSAPEHQVKVSVRSPLMLPRVALVDPELTWSMPREVTASTGLDALTQLIEPFVSSKANPMTDAICRQAMPLAADSLPRAYENGADREAREAMAFAGLCGGMALANAGLGAVHGIAGPFGGMFGAPHGAVCAALLGPITRANLHALRSRAPEHPAMERYHEAACICLSDPSANADDLGPWLDALATALAIPGLATYGFGEDDFAALIPKAMISSSMKGNPLPLLEEEVAAALRAAL
jgi:alcohol dehydrogenase class IV